MNISKIKKNLHEFNSFAAKKAFMLFLERLAFGELTLKTHDGETFVFKRQHSNLSATLRICDPEFYSLVLEKGAIGFAKAYINGYCETPNLLDLFRLLAKNLDTLNPSNLVTKSVQQLFKSYMALTNNSIDRAKENISYHYDLGNDFYKLWLDKTMTYSAGIFINKHDSLEQAQYNKYQRVLQQLKLQYGKVLEIGCGWGGFAKHAVSNNLKVKGLSLSQRQLQYAGEILKNTPGVEFAYQDYRHETGSYDAIVSIEMFEAVGKEYWHSYFETLHKCLKSKGRVVLQTITILEEFAEDYENNIDFIQKYIFPGGMLPTHKKIVSLAKSHKFNVRDVYFMGQDYAKTLHIWWQNFESQLAKVMRLGFDEKFVRMWRYYLLYCISGFESERINVVQYTFEKI